MSQIKNIIICAAVSAAAASAGAQTSVTMYGLLDTSVEHLTNTGPNGRGLTRVPSLTGTLPSRLGFRGKEDLGGGLNAVFALEMGIAPDSGALNQGGRAFGRQAYVGLAGPWGSVTVGRQYTALLHALFDAEILGPNAFGTASFDSYLPNTRVDNSIAYMGKFSGWTLGGTYSLGRDAVNAGPSPSGTNCPGENSNDSKACREWSALVKYDTPAWGAAFATDAFRGGPGAFAGLTASSMTDKRTTLNGYAKFGPLKVGGGLLRRKNDAATAAPRSDLWFLGASYKVTSALVIDAELIRYRVKSTSQGGTQVVVRAMHNFSKRTGVYVNVGRMNNDGTSAFSVSASQSGGSPPAGASQTGLGIGIRHFF